VTNALAVLDRDVLVENGMANQLPSDDAIVEND